MGESLSRAEARDCDVCSRGSLCFTNLSYQCCAVWGEYAATQFLVVWVGLGWRCDRDELGACVRHSPGRTALDADWPVEKTLSALVANTARFAARDYLLDRLSDRAALDRFEVFGFERLRAMIAAGRGVILVGSHLGAHIAGVHWLFRSGLPLRLLVQRPRHVSRELNRRFDQIGPHPQAELFLRRDLPPAAAVERALALERVFGMAWRST